GDAAMSYVLGGVVLLVVVAEQRAPMPRTADTCGRTADVDASVERHGASASDPKRANNGAPNTILVVLAFALPREGSDHFLAGKNGTDLFSRSNGQIVALQLEKSHLVLAGEKLIPGYVDLGRELVALDCEWTGVNHECLEECCRFRVVSRRLAICRRDDECRVPVRRDEQSAFRIATKWFSEVATNDLNGPRRQLPAADQLPRCVLRKSQSRREIAIDGKSERKETH